MHKSYPKNPRDKGIFRTEITEKTDLQMYEELFNDLPSVAQDHFIQLLNQCEKQHPTDDINIRQVMRLSALTFYSLGFAVSNSIN